MGDLNLISNQDFERIRQLDTGGNEFWLARDLSKVLEYSDYRNFISVIDRAKQACINSAQSIQDHFEDLLDSAAIGSGAKREIRDCRLSRYACYLIVQNGDPSKPVIANGQTYFAIQTRRQELQELQDKEVFKDLSEGEKRLAIRNEITEHNKLLALAAKNAGVESPLDYAVFQDYGYKGLYGGLGVKDIHKKKKLKKTHKILDHMGSTELAANLFRTTQTEEKLRRDRVLNKLNANKTHRQVGAKVRRTILDLGGTMPEDLPTPERSIQQLENQKKKISKNKSSRKTLI